MNPCSVKASICNSQSSAHLLRYLFQSVINLLIQMSSPLLKHQLAPQSCLLCAVSTLVTLPVNKHRPCMQIFHRRGVHKDPKHSLWPSGALLCWREASSWAPPPQARWPERHPGEAGDAGRLEGPLPPLPECSPVMAANRGHTQTAHTRVSSWVEHQNMLYESRFPPRRLLINRTL